MIKSDPKYLMMIEPKGKKEPAIEDALTQIAKAVLSSTTRGTQYRGSHTCNCGERGGSCDLITPDGKITNSLLVHYVREHRSEVPLAEIEKLTQSHLVITNQ